MTFDQILQQFRDTSFSERDKGYRFERLMQSFLKTLPEYADLFKTIWLWSEFPSRADFGSGDKDLGIDLVALTKYGDYWAVQCKCYKEDAIIDKPKLDTFLSTSGKSFYDTLEIGKKVNFTCRLWIDTTIKGFNREAEATIHNQTPEVKRIGYYQLTAAAVDWQKIFDGLSGAKASVKKYDPLPHQQTAITDTHNYLKTHDRGKLIMACGTGKTFTSLRIAEKETDKSGGLVLFLVPSIALLGQTLREWKTQCAKPLHAICICSDAAVSKSSKTNIDDTTQISVTDLALPASTNIKTITRQFENARTSQKNEGGNIVVFSTYQSIDVISEVQKTFNRNKKDSFLFDLVICDEAHRTTGVTLADKNEAAFVKVHDTQFIKSKKRIYMTATPRIYSTDAQTKAKEASAEVCSMDDVAMYGEEMHRIGFGEAVDQNLLSDYKVIVLTMDETQLDDKLKKSIEEKKKENKNIEIDAEETLKIIGCINVLSKKSLTNKELFEGSDPAPMKSAVAFCQNIALSKETTDKFNATRDAYFETLTEEKRRSMVIVEADHVDGTMGAQKREQKLHWLKSADPAKNECKILHNVRCLSEGVDVPSLDAVIFFSARNSQIDVVQSVGRVMRKSEGKKYGYIIIPIVVLPKSDPDKTLDADRYKIVWKVLNALRAHDERFDAMINKIDLNKKKGGKVDQTGANTGGSDNDDTDTGAPTPDGGGAKSPFQKQLELELEKLQGQIYAKIVLKCGNKPYWEQWAADVAKIAQRHIESITATVKKKGAAKDEFEKYLNGLRKNINPAVTEQEAIEMLAQHIITQPVFEALFEDYSFVKNNTVSQSLQGIITALNEQTKKSDTEKLNKFYVSVQTRASGIDNSEGKQKIIIELYDKFFRTAFPKVTEKLGIVYTPVEIVDFIIHSVEDILQKEFTRSMTDENVHILDPFTGTGTFITRLLQSGIIQDVDLKRKYLKEIHANEIVLLAYYIASINIENVYHERVGSREWGVGNRESGVRRQSVLPTHSDYGQIPVNDNYLLAAEKIPEYGEVGTGDLGLGVGEEDYNDKIIQGFDGLAGSDEFGRDGLSSNKNFPERGTVRADQPNKAGGGFDSGKYSGGQRTEKPEGIPAVSVDSKRFNGGTRNAFADSGTAQFINEGNFSKTTEPTKFSGSSVVRTEKIANPHSLTPSPQSPNSYTSFPGICLTDTFQLGETKEGENLFSEIFPQNSERVLSQQNTPLRIIFGNPPYSVGQKSANDNAQNQPYPKLDTRIANTYAASSTAVNKNSLYDTYIKAFRWSTDRLDPDNGGIICFVSNGSWIDGNAQAGFRSHLEKEFSSIHVFNLRGNCRTSGELRQKEAGNIFGLGSRTPISVTLLVKNPKQKIEKAIIHYYDIGDYHSREKKLQIIKDFSTVNNINWSILSPNKQSDWINFRNDSFSTYIPIIDKENNSQNSFFYQICSNGLKTGRDQFCYNYSNVKLSKNIKQTINFYNEQCRDYHIAKKKKPKLQLEDFLTYDSKKISWNEGFKQDIEREKTYKFIKDNISVGLYRPYSKQYFYYAKELNDRTYQIPKIFPSKDFSNIVICISGLGVNKDFSVIITDLIPDVQLQSNAQCFPLYWYEKKETKQHNLFENTADDYIRHDAISDFILEQAQTRYGGRAGKEDIFYYVYGILHQSDYRKTFANDLKKMLPRLPLVEKAADFWAFSKAGRELAELHLNYEEQPSPKEILINGKSMPNKPFPADQLIVNQMKFPAKNQKDTIIYNSHITISNIPQKAYQYIVNGKSAIEWVMERYAVTTHKDSGITNNPNDWAAEHENPQYILDLLLSVITVSMKTVDIVAELPKVEWE